MYHIIRCKCSHTDSEVSGYELYELKYQSTSNQPSIGHILIIYRGNGPDNAAMVASGTKQYMASGNIKTIEREKLQSKEEE